MSTSAGRETTRAGDFQRQLRAFRRHVPLIVLSFLAVVGTAVALSRAQEKQYSASASLLFREASLDQALFGTNLGARYRDPDREAATNVRLLSLDRVADRAAKRLEGRTDLGTFRPTVDAIRGGTEVEPAGKSDLVDVTFTHTSPRVAAIVANAFAHEYVTFRRDADRSTVEEAIELVENELATLSPAAARGDEGRSLRRRAEQLKILRSLQTGNAEVVQNADIPTSPSSPKPVRNAVLGGFLGLLLGLGLALLSERLDRRLRDTKDVEELFDRPVLGVIPHVSNPEAGKLPAVAAEAYRLARANLRYFDVNRDLRSILITSAAPADGKTTIACNLARVAAESGSRVLLMETDLRKPTISARFGIDGSRGLTTLLATDATLESTVQSVPIWSGVETRVDRTVDVLPAGPLPPNPGDLIESDRFREVLSLAESIYDLVLIDTPPMSVVSDAIPLTRQVSGVIVVVRLGHSSIDVVGRLRDDLENLDAPLLGVVINGMRARGTDYGYGYAYAAAEYAPAADDAQFAELTGKRSG